MIKSFPSYHASTLLVRIVVGLIFLSEGIQKSLTPEATGAGRFATTFLLVLLLMYGGGNFSFDQKLKNTHRQ